MINEFVTPKLVEELRLLLQEQRNPARVEELARSLYQEVTGELPRKRQNCEFEPDIHT